MKAMPTISAARQPGATPFATIVSVAGPRAVNEDAAAIDGTDPALAFYVVADGIGGRRGGDLAAQTAVAAVVESFRTEQSAAADLAGALVGAIKLANERVYGLALETGLRGMGCTLVAAAVGEGALVVAHAGDARAYLLQDGALRALTQDHTWVQVQVDAGLITPDEAAGHDLRHVILRAVGVEASLDPAVTGRLPFGPGSRLLLCSDGLHDVLGEAEMALLLGRASAGAAARALVAAALARGASDNVTALVAVAPDGKSESSLAGAGHVFNGSRA